ncbi:transposase [Microbacterium enclense]|uniref:transposase n=1 Tax=Microbacterium enclense TaxID=993073 RepID=UPI003F81DE4A
MHHLVDRRGLPLVVVVASGRATQAPKLLVVMDHLKGAHRCTGRPRSRLNRVCGDKAYSSSAIRKHLRERGIVAVIPVPSTTEATAGAATSLARDGWQRRRGLQRPCRRRRRLPRTQAVALHVHRLGFTTSAFQLRLRR